MSIRNLFCFLFLALAFSSLIEARTDDPEQREPSADAEPHTVYAATAENGLRYTWVLPEDYDPEVPRNLTVICHGTGLDYRWGHWNNKPGVFRPDDIVVSVDGPTPNGDSRLFTGEKKDAEAVRDFLHELREAFSIDRAFLYGHSQGGFFVVYFAGEFPEEVAGVAAHASGAWNWSKKGKKTKEVAIAYMHGTLDPVVPYRQSSGSRDGYSKDGFEILHLRRLPRYNHWPNSVRANEVVGWCQGMSAHTPEEALDVAREILRPKGHDDVQWQTVVGFSGANDVLLRVVGQGPRPFEDVEPKTLRAAEKLLKAIDDHGAKHVAALKKHVSRKKGLELDDGPWLGHMLSLREDFRGVASVEAYFETIGFDKALAGQRRAVDKILEAWYSKKPPGAKYEAILENLADAYLFEGFPPELAETMNEWHGVEDRYDLSKKVLKKWSDFEAWEASWNDGLEEYNDLWKKWQGD